ncbi:hypothetical protein [Paramicrobacterium chengjingii]|uniref:hypothetical protein n=1 Tax=Paramicrobacterium chengjingii TaxID=2769067 RepID=UPI0014236ED2|nr:hypothetical protein [Microbacterium chengjingii]
MEAHARNTDPETSHWAAAGVAVSEVQARIIDVLEAHQQHYPLGLTDEKIEIEYRAMFGHDATEQSLRSRRAELVSKGLVAWTGFRARNIRNKWCRTWALPTEEEMAA